MHFPPEIVSALIAACVLIIQATAAALAHRIRSTQRDIEQDLEANSRKTEEIAEMVSALLVAAKVVNIDDKAGS